MDHLLCLYHGKASCIFGFVCAGPFLGDGKGVEGRNIIVASTEGVPEMPAVVGFWVQTGFQIAHQHFSDCAVKTYMKEAYVTVVIVTESEQRIIILAAYIPDLVSVSLIAQHSGASSLF